MSDPAISVQGVTKSYRIGTARKRHDSLRDFLADLAKAPFRRAQRRRDETIWALDDVSFEVRPGEVLGVIGRNGAGKSTLLKILARISAPTRGRAVINGRVGSLLEVGTGFHPELTGRENIFLNGAILGMRRAEIVRKFDEMVAFAEIERFLDTPVKRYSSGMYVRLAFSVAAHLEPEILLVDEVLAVGDAAFQEKCLGKMGDAAKGGRTILFVSHNMGAISELCQKAIVLDGGKVKFQGGAGEAISHYMRRTLSNAERKVDLRDWSHRTGLGKARFTWAEVSWESRNGEQAALPAIGDTLVVSFGLFRQDSVDPASVILGLSISTATGIRVLHVLNEDAGFELIGSGDHIVTVQLPGLALFPGVYVISLWAGRRKTYVEFDFVRNCLTVEVVQGNFLPRAHRTDWNHGLVHHESQWRTP